MTGLTPVARPSDPPHPDRTGAGRLDTTDVGDATAAPPRVVRGLRLVLALVGGAFLAGYVAIAIARMRYPYELEWIEGGVVDEVRQALSGHSLYVKPSLHYMPNIYTPLYYYVAAVPAKIFGLGFFAPRLVSFLASLAAFACVGALVRTETRDNLIAFVSACVFAACFRRGGAWFDLARVDSLFVALLFAGLVVARRARTARGAAAAGVLMTLSFLAKQSALIPAFAVAIFLFCRVEGAEAAEAPLGEAVRKRSTVSRWLRRHSLAVWYLGTLGAELIVTTALLNLWSHGWYRFYVIDMPAAHQIVSQEYRAFWTTDLLAPLGIALVLSVVGLWWTTRLRTDDGVAPAWFHVPVFAGLLASAYQGRLHSGGYDNVLFPAFGAVAIGVGLGVHAVSAVAASKVASASPRRARVAAWATPLALLLAVVQLGTLTYDPLAQIPSAAHHRTGARMLAALRSLPGTVYLPGHGEYLRRVGKQGSTHSSAIEDVIRADVRGHGKAIARELDDDVSAGRWDWIVVDSAPTFSYLPSSLQDAYVRVGTLVPRRHPPLPLTGTMTGPLTVWARRDPPPPGGVPADLVPIPPGTR